MEDIKTIFWDFDGVILNSNEVRSQGFAEVLKDFPIEQVNQLMKFHNENGGLSRYVKFRYFFEEVRKEILTDQKLKFYNDSFSKIMRESLIDSKLLILETNNFIKKNYLKFQMHIVSGSDEVELNFLCEKLGIARYFISINGSPTPKTKLVFDLISKQNYEKSKCLLIGDSINDWEAAKHNNIKFMAYNSPKFLQEKSEISIVFN
jgi:phosphoglycolate phosphatase-like HAD superfamily hydrolase